MDLLLWMAVGFIVIGFVVSVSMKKNMENRVALIKGNMESKVSSAKPVIWWITGTTIWGIVTMKLVVWLFSRNM